MILGQLSPPHARFASGNPCCIVLHQIKILDKDFFSNFVNGSNGKTPKANMTHFDPEARALNLCLDFIVGKCWESVKSRPSNQLENFKDCSLDQRNHTSLLEEDRC